MLVKITAFVNKDELEEIDNDFEEALCYDYTEVSVEVEFDEVYREDNVHGNPEDYINGLLKGLEWCDQEIEIEYYIVGR